MITTKRLFLVLIAIICTTQIFAQSVITYTHPTAGEGFATTFSDAVTNAPAGSTIYIPGGVFNTDNIEITKELTIIGAGHNIDSTGATGITYLVGNLEFAQDSDNSFLTGVSLNGILYIAHNNSETVSNIRVARCSISTTVSIATATGSSVSNISFKENIIGNSNIMKSIEGGNISNSSSVSFSNCIINGYIGSIKNYLIKNCIILGHTNSSPPYLISGVDNSTFENNIFTYNNSATVTVNSSGNIFNNNLFVSGSNQNGGTYSNSMINVSIDELFVNYSSGIFNYENDFHLKPACVGVNAGTDGTDVGIYGTDEPFKEGSLPFNPHIYFKDIAPVTNPDGSLQIEIKARVLDN